MHNFKDHKVPDLNKVVTSMLKKHKTIAAATQGVLMSVAYEIEANGDAKGLTQFVIGLSKVTEKDVELSSTARAVGYYMTQVLNVRWDRKSKSFVMQDGEFDYSAAYVTMTTTRWDTFEKKKASAEFDADKTLLKAIGMIKSIIAKADNGELKTDDPAFLKARTIAKAF